MRLTLETLHYYATASGDCLLWRLGTNGRGYPQACLGGKPGCMVRRYVFTSLLGREIARGSVVSSRCENPLCLAPDHLVSMRRGAVQARSYSNGSRMHAAEYSARLRSAIRHGRARLNWERVAAIRAMPESRTHQSIALEFAVHAKTIARVRAGLSWRLNQPASSVFNWRPA